MSIYSKIKHFFHPVQGEIWCLHRVVAERSKFPSNKELEITPDYLDNLIAQYKDYGFQFVPIDEIVGKIDVKTYDLRRKQRINISFDDGFRDIYENAFPIFIKHNIPFTIYLVGNFPNGTSDLWWIQLERMSNGDVEAYESLMKECYRSERNMRDLMHERTNSFPDPVLCKELSLSWEQLQEMVASGLCTVGSHSMTHPGLTRIDLGVARWELMESKKMIESHLPGKVRHFSYPHSMENAKIQALLKECGYESATLGYGGSIRKGDNPFKLNRRYIVQP